jgi:uncharacterized protein YciI
MAEARDWTSNDPYSQANLFESTKLIEWNKLIG